MKRFKKVIIRLSVFAMSFLVGMTIAKVAKAQPSSNLWKISGNELTKPSYLMGTIHLLCEDELNFSTSLKDAIASSEQLFLELDFDDPQMMQELQAGIMLREGQKLEDLLSKKEMKTLDDFLQREMGASVESFASVKPFFIMSMLYPQFLGCPTVSMEMQLVGLAKSHSQEVFGLETVEEELAALDAMPLDVQTDFLLESIKDINGGKDELNKMRELYNAQDIEALYSFTSDGFDEYMDGYDEIILDKRNKAWISKMTNAMTKKPTFFAVGAAHLAGPQGVIELLRSNGYRVEPVIQEYETSIISDSGSDISPLVRSWKIDDSQIESTLTTVIESILQKNPEAAAQVEAQKSAIESMVRNTVKEYHADGTYTITIPYSGTQTGTWELNETGDTLTESDQEGEVSVKKVIELSDHRMVLINDEGEEKIYQSSE